MDRSIRFFLGLCNSRLGLYCPHQLSLLHPYCVAQRYKETRKSASGYRQTVVLYRQKPIKCTETLEIANIGTVSVPESLINSRSMYMSIAQLATFAVTVVIGICVVYATVAMRKMYSEQRQKLARATFAVEELQKLRGEAILILRRVESDGHALQQI